jgi:hypothetical protein
LNAPAAPDAPSTASASPIGCHQANPGPLATAMPASALAAMATPILSFNSEIAMVAVARMLHSPLRSRPVSGTARVRTDISS